MVEQNDPNAVAEERQKEDGVEPGADRRIRAMLIRVLEALDGENRQFIALSGYAMKSATDT